MWYKICSIESKTTYMKNTSIILAALTMICCSPASKEHQTKGIVCDATMNTISIVTANKDTLSFSTLDADKSHVTGLLLNDTAEIFYKGKYTAGMSATKPHRVQKSSIGSITNKNLRGDLTRSFLFWHSLFLNDTKSRT